MTIKHIIYKHKQYDVGLNLDVLISRRKGKLPFEFKLYYVEQEIQAGNFKIPRLKYVEAKQTECLFFTDDEFLQYQNNYPEYFI